METKEKPGKIGIDIDDVLIDFLPSFLAFYNGKHGTRFSPEDFHFWKRGC